MATYELGREIPMTRDGISWRAWKVTSHEGTLLLPYDASLALGEVLLRPLRKLERKKPLGQGHESKIFKQRVRSRGNVALRVFLDEEQDNFLLGTVKDLQVNYGLYYGLNRMQQAGRWRIRSPELFGAFLPNDTPERRLEQEQGNYELNTPRWAMERIKHIKLDIEERRRLSRTTDFPSSEARRQLFNVALERFGVANLKPHYDDDFELHNILVEKFPVQSEPGSLVFIDAAHLEESST